MSFENNFYFYGFTYISFFVCWMITRLFIEMKDSGTMRFYSPNIKSFFLIERENKKE